MKIEMIKQAGGLLVPACDIEAEKLTKFKTGELYTVDIKKTRNPSFHRKTFAFFNFCYEHWNLDDQFMDDVGQREVFRNHLTVMAGFYDEYYKLDGGVRVEAKSLAYSNMEDEEFEQHYRALVSAAMRHIFTGCGQDAESRLMSFF